MRTRRRKEEGEGGGGGARGKTGLEDVSVFIVMLKRPRSNT